MRNLIVSSFTILLLIFSSCEEDIVKGFENIANENIEHSSKNNLGNLEKDVFIEADKGELILDVASLYLECIADSKFVVRATYKNETNSISFEYYRNGAYDSLVSPASPVSIDWNVNNGLVSLDDVGSETATVFDFNRDYNVGISIVFDDGSTFEDQFCVNIDEADASAFNVCSEHESTVGCSENRRGSNKRALVVVDIGW